MLLFAIKKIDKILITLVIIFLVSEARAGDGKSRQSETKYAAPTSWSVITNKDFGTTLYYPSNWFKAKPETGTRQEVLLTSPDGRALLSLSASLDPMRTGAEATAVKFKNSLGRHRIRKIIEGPYDLEIYGKDGKGGLSYVRYVYSCRERVVNRFALSYPSSEQEKYESIIPKMKRRFSAGIGVKTPVRECS